MSTKALTMSIVNIHFLKLLNINKDKLHNSAGFYFFYYPVPNHRISFSENTGKHR